MGVRPAMRAIRRRSIIVGAGIGLAALAAWHVRAPVAPQQPHFVEVAPNTYILPKPDPLADFRLVRHDDAPFSNDALMGRWSFMIFGYTFCPDFCPSTLAMFNELHGLLAQRAEGTRDVQFVLVSVDPERDTPRLLREYVPQFNREFVGVTGDATVIARLAESVGAVYAKVPGGAHGHYLVDHSTAVLLVNPQGRLQGVLAAPHTVQGMLEGFQQIRARAGADPAQAASRAGPISMQQGR